MLTLNNNDGSYTISGSPVQADAQKYKIFRDSTSDAPNAWVLQDRASGQKYALQDPKGESENAAQTAAIQGLQSLVTDKYGVNYDELTPAALKSYVGLSEDQRSQLQGGGQHIQGASNLNQALDPSFGVSDGSFEGAMNRANQINQAIVSAKENYKDSGGPLGNILSGIGDKGLLSIPLTALAATGAANMFGLDAAAGAGAGAGAGAVPPESYWNMVAGDVPAGSLPAADLTSAGLDAITTGQAATPFTTAPSFAELGGVAGGGGLGATLTNLLTPTPSGVAASVVGKALQNGGSTDQTSQDLATAAASSTPVDPNTNSGVGSTSITGTGSGDLGLNDFLPGGKYASLLGTGLSGLLGLAGADATRSSLNSALDLIKPTAEAAGGAYRNALANPDSWYQSAPAMGATDAVLRKLSVNGNPAMDPGALSKAAAYNLGGYTNYLSSTGNTAVGAANAANSLTAPIAANAAAPYNVAGATLGSALNPTPSLADLLKQYGNIGSGIKYAPT